MMLTLLSIILGGGKGTKISAIVGAILLVAASTFIGLKLVEIHQLHSKIEKQNVQITNLSLDNKILTENNAILKNNQEVLKSSNQSNYDAAKKLDEERAESKAAIITLASQNVKSKEAIEILKHTISTLSTDPKNDGPVAKVLIETVRQIQANRDTK